MCAKPLQLYLTLCDPVDCSWPGSSVHGILQAGILEWVPMLSSRDQTGISCIGRQILYHCTTWEAPFHSQFSSLKLLSRVQLFATSWTAAHQASLSITNFWSLPKLMSIESVMPSNHLILCCPLLLLPSIFPSIRVFSSESALHIRWPKY